MTVYNVIMHLTQR